MVTRDTPPEINQFCSPCMGPFGLPQKCVKFDIFNKRQRCPKCLWSSNHGCHVWRFEGLVGIPGPNISHFLFLCKTPSWALFVNIFGKQSLIKTLYPPYEPNLQSSFGPLPLVGQNEMWHGHSWHCKGFKRPVWLVKRWFGGVSLHGLAFPGLPDSCHKTPRIEDARTNGWRVGGSYREKPNKSFCLFGRTVNRPKISSQA